MQRFDEANGDANKLSIDEEEEELAFRLKQLCDEKGREVNTNETAQLLRKLGLVYRKRSPDKLSLIQGCALLNAAIVRNPKNVETITYDLLELCSHVLSLANAEQKKANLVEAGKNLFKPVKEMRKKAFEKLEKTNRFSLSDNDQESFEKEKTNAVQELQLELANDYSAIMKSISDYAVSILGQPPCSYCHMGLGSLARKEVTPFSDFESVIVLEENIQHSYAYPDVLEYFRWFTVIFQIIVLNFGETIIPSVAVKSLNDFLKEGGDWFFDVHTPRGICFDGLMPHASKTPLGRQVTTPSKSWKTELIKPVSEMIKYLSSEEDIKNGYHLADILTTTCFVSGNPELCQIYQQMVFQKNLDAGTVMSKLDLKQLQDDFKAFSVIESLSSAYNNKRIRTKQMVYRSSTLFISFLGKTHHVKSTSSFEIISELEQKKIITTEAAHNLRYAVAIACDVRLRTYMVKKAQSEVISLHRKNTNNSGELKDLEAIVSLHELINYFKITFCLQKAISNGRLEHYEGDMRTAGKDVDCAILFYLLQYEDAFEEAKKLRETYLFKENEEKAISCTAFIKECLFRLERYNDALEESRNELCQQLQLKSVDYEAIASCKKAVGKCLFKLNRFVESAHERQGELNIKAKSNKYSEDNLTSIRDIAYCYFANQNYELALKWFNCEKSEIEENFPITAKQFIKLVHCLSNLAGCHFKMRQYTDAISQYKQAKDILLGTSRMENKYESLAECCRHMGHCFNKLNNYTKALASYEEELILLNEESLTSDKKTLIYDCHSNIAGCHFNLKNYKDALQFYEKILGAPNANPFHIKTLRSIATCLFFLERYNEALNYHQLELDMIGPFSRKDFFQKAQCLGLIATDFYKLDQVVKSLETSQQELELRLQLDDGETSLYTARCLNAIASCYIRLNDFKAALDNYQKELKIRKENNHNGSEAKNIANIEHNISICESEVTYASQ